jgi:hypothetical protein
MTPPRTTVEETALDLANGAATAEDAVAWMLCAVASRRTNSTAAPRTRRARDLDAGRDNANVADGWATPALRLDRGQPAQPPRGRPPRPLRLPAQTPRQSPREPAR